MKTAMVITGDTQQVILSPENEIDKQVIEAIRGKEGGKAMSLHVGSFWNEDRYGSRYYSYKSSILQACQGGWLREYADAKSLIIVLKAPEPEAHNKQTPEEVV